LTGGGSLSNFWTNAQGWFTLLSLDEAVFAHAFQGHNPMSISLTVNGRKRVVEAEADKPLLWVLREDLDMPGTKFGCGAGLCGACTVHLDGEAVRSCQTPIADAAGKAITTIEGVATNAIGKRVAAAWAALDVPQCGYCQAGQIMSATALLKQNPKPTADDIDGWMSGNICRCATYLRIRAAIRQAAGLAPEIANAGLTDGEQLA
jgi:isoquinoline 1-oxidoreductase subunit alpha